METEKLQADIKKPKSSLEFCKKCGRFRAFVWDEEKGIMNCCGCKWERKIEEVVKK